MITVRSPLRLSFGGGGTDLPSYYREHEGFLIAAAIDKYVYITIHQTFQKQLILKYSSLEHCDSIDEVKHPIVREALKLGAMIDNLHFVKDLSLKTKEALESLMFYAEDKVRLRHAIVQAGLREVRFRFDFEGSKTIVQ